MDLSNWDYDDSLATFRREVEAVDSPTEWTQLRNAYLSKKNGLVGKLMAALREAPRELKPKLGKEINLFKREVEARFKADPPAKAVKKVAGLDLTLPGVPPARGTLHPLTLTLRHMLDFFVKMGYDIAEGPEIETNFYNFEALNTPATHPARDDKDTYYIDPERMLRTQTSGCQIRYMEQHQPPLRMVAPGRVFRRDDDPTHSPMFQQLEGLVVGKDIHFGHLKGTLEAFAQYMFGEDTTIRLRPSYFPFTEPSAEVDASCPFCTEGCRLCKHTRWIEILGSGMVDPNVFKAVGYDPEAVTGFAFGIGIERVAMLKYNVPHISYFYQNDRRFLDQFAEG